MKPTASLNDSRAPLAVLVAGVMTTVLAFSLAGCTDRPSSELPEVASPGARQLAGVRDANCEPIGHPDPDSSLLRIRNHGPAPVSGLVVIFPGYVPNDPHEAPLYLCLSFGYVPVGGMTEYRTVQQGVYPYAAYRYQIEGREHTQPVTDFASPRLPKGAYTYDIGVEQYPNSALSIRLLRASPDQQ